MSNAEASSKKATALLLPKLLQVGMAIPRLFVVFLGKWRNRAIKTFLSFKNMRNCNLFPWNLGIERNRMFSLENNNIHTCNNKYHTSGKQESHCHDPFRRRGMDGIIPTTSGEATSGRNYEFSTSHERQSQFTTSGEATSGRN